MAQQFVTENGTLIIPGSYATFKVQADNSGLATSGVLMLIGEAEAGPGYALEDDLEANAFGPDQVSEVRAKYRSGPLVDAFRAAASPANDPNIVGSPARIILVKTNPSTKARASILMHDSSVYGYIADKSYGKFGNSIYTEIVAATAEVKPTTGAMTFIPPVGTVAYALRANGAAAVGGTLAADTQPAGFASIVDALAGVTATGGANRAAAPTTGNISLAIVSGNTVQVDTTVAFLAQPVVGDTFVIPDGSVIEGTSNANVGAYVVISTTATQVIATKLSDAGKPGAVAGTITTPTAVSAVAIVGAADLVVYAPVTITLDAADPIPGIGKSLEVAQLTTGTDLLERTLFALSVTPVTFVSKSGAPKLLTSASEYSVHLNVNRQADAVSQELIAGGEVALKIAYAGTSATVTITDAVFTTTVVGGLGANLALDLKDYQTIGDLATFINSTTSYTASVGSGILGQLPATALDDVATQGISTSFGAQTGRLKVDGYKLFKKIAEEAVLVQLEDADGNIVQSAKGLPAPAAVAYLAGGTKGATTAATALAAIDALEKVRGNFLVPLFSRNASEDITDGLTESGSTYAIEAIHAACVSHVLKMSTLKRRRNRQAFLSIRDTFANAIARASNTASFRCVMTFQDIKNLSDSGVIAQYQPWMGAVIAAAMQAAGLYKAIVGKFANVSGVLQAAKDFDDRDITPMENALLAGLLPMKRGESGGFEWVSDQTTYGKDANFVFNSVQATYIADLMAITMAMRMEKAFKGQSVADVSAGVALSFLESILDDFVRLKFIAPSDDAPKGYKNVKVKINGPAMIVTLEVKLAGAIYFIPIQFLVSQVQQSAG